MDVRCERCRAEYVIADEEVGDEGLALRCAGCGHVFRVKRKEFVVTVPVKPEELRKVAPVSTADLDRRRRDAEALASAPAGEGPVVAGDFAPVAEDRWEAPRQGRAAGDEPAWAAQGRSPAPPERPERPRQRQRASMWPKLALLGLVLAAGAAVVLFRPEWVGLGPVVLPGMDRPLVPAAGSAARTGEAKAGPPRAAPKPPSGPAAAPAPAPLPGPLPAARGEGAETKPPAATPAPAPAPAPTATPTATAKPPAAPAPLPNPLPAARGEGGETEPPPATEGSRPSPPPGERAGRGGEAVSASAPPAAAKPPKRVARVEQPTGPKALVAEASRLRDRGRVQAALDVYARALTTAPEDADALAGRGLCYLDLSQYRPAEASFEEALRADAKHAEALMGLAETYRYEGRRDEAVTYYQRYLAAHPQGRDAAAARSAIDALKE